MQVLSALTPPLLVCAVVIAAIVAFLRHEMRRSPPDSSASGDQDELPFTPNSEDPDNGRAGLTDVPRAPADDCGQHHNA